MFILLHNGEFAGTSEQEVEPPNEEWSIIPADEFEPPAPVEPVGPLTVTPVSSLNWTLLESALRNSEAWGKAYMQAEKSVKANAAFTLILTTVSTTRNLNDLRFGWDRLRTTMQSQSSLDDFSAVELEFVRTTLTECGFDPEEFNLGAA